MNFFENLQLQHIRQPFYGTHRQTFREFAKSEPLSAQGLCARLALE
jgi:hypothetical protein